jgi:hypothetical protein
VIKPRRVSALPAARWALIAEPSVSSAEARGAVYRKPTARSVRAEEEPRPLLPPQLGEADWRFIGPRRKPYWMTETDDPADLAQRLAAKEAYAARVQQLRDNPSYRVSPNGFRFECTDCGGTFEDDREGRHADGLASGQRAGELTGGSGGRHRELIAFVSRPGGGQIWPEFGQIWPKAGQFWPKNRLCFSRCRLVTISGQLLAQNGPVLAKNGQILTGGEMARELGQFRPNSGPSLGRKWAIFG